MLCSRYEEGRSSDGVFWTGSARRPQTAPRLCIRRLFDIDSKLLQTSSGKEFCRTRLRLGCRWRIRISSPRLLGHSQRGSSRPPLEREDGEAGRKLPAAEFVSTKRR